MATLEDLRGAVQESLETRGVLGSMKARLRAEIFRSINDGSLPPPSPAPETTLINELIREYLDYQGYHHTRSVFLPESGQPAEPQREIGREVVEHELGLAGRDDSASGRLPLLYTMVAALRDHNTAEREESFMAARAAAATALSAGSAVAKGRREEGEFVDAPGEISFVRS